MYTVVVTGALGVMVARVLTVLVVVKVSVMLYFL